MKIKDTIEEIIIYDKIDYIIENMSAKDLASYIYHNYNNYALDLEFNLGVEEMEDNDAEPNRD